MREGIHAVVETDRAANTYEAPGCQGTKISSERFFAFFSACVILASLAIGSVS